MIKWVTKLDVEKKEMERNRARKKDSIHSRQKILSYWNPPEAKMRL